MFVFLWLAVRLVCFQETKLIVPTVFYQTDVPIKLFFVSFG
jgi:hypothetical protein